MNKKGFTLVEVLAVIVILGLLITLITPKVMSNIKNKRNTLYENTVKEIEKVSSMYLTNNPDLYGKISSDGFTNISINSLCIDNLINCPVIDSRDGSEINGYVKVSYIDNKYEYEFINQEYINENILLDIVLNGGSISSNPTGTYKEGDLVEIGTPVKEGLEFKGWEVVKGNSKLNGNKLTIGSTDTILYALWQKEVLFTVDLNGGTQEQEFKEKYVVGDIIELTEPTRIGYTFTCWEIISGNSIISGNNIVIGTENTKIKANWEINTYAINYELDGGTHGSNSPTSGTYGSTVEVSNPIKTGYTFTGWTVSGIGSVLNGTSLTIGDGNITLTANWRINKVYIKFHANGGTVTESTVNNGTTYTWTTSSDIIARNGIQTFHSINYGESKYLLYYNNSSYLNITKTNYVAKSGAEWICSSGCTTANKTFSQTTPYNASDFCDASNGDCTVTVKVNWQTVVNVPTQSGTLTYTGSAQSPTWNNYNTSQLTIGGTTSGTNAGNYSATFTPNDGYSWSDGKTTAKTVNWTVGKAAGSLTISASSGTITGIGNTKTFTVTRAGNGTISVKSSNTSVATVSVSGTTVTMKAVAGGTATITVSVAEGTNHNAPSNKTYSLTVTPKVYLYNAGNQYKSITGGWTTSGYGAFGYSKVHATFNSENIYIYGVNDVGAGGVGTVNKINLSSYTKVKILYSADSVSYSRLSVVTSKGDIYNTTVAKASLSAGTNKTVSLDISSISTSCYIAVVSKHPIYIYQVWLE